MSTKLSCLMAKDTETINNKQIRDLLISIRNMERRLVAPVPAPVPTPVPAPVPAPLPAPVQSPVQIPGPAAPQDQVDRANIAAAMPPSSSDSDAGAPARQAAAWVKKRRRKQSLGQLVRENQLLYKRWMTKKVPKIMRELGISSSSSDDDV